MKGYHNHPKSHTINSYGAFHTKQPSSIIQPNIIMPDIENLINTSTSKYPMPPLFYTQKYFSKQMGNDITLYTRPKNPDKLSIPPLTPDEIAHLLTYQQDGVPKLMSDDFIPLYANYYNIPEATRSKLPLIFRYHKAELDLKAPLEFYLPKFNLPAFISSIVPEFSNLPEYRQNDIISLLASMLYLPNIPSIKDRLTFYYQLPPQTMHISARTYDYKNYLIETIPVMLILNEPYMPLEGIINKLYEMGYNAYGHDIKYSTYLDDITLDDYLNRIYFDIVSNDKLKHLTVWHDFRTNITNGADIIFCLAPLIYLNLYRTYKNLDYTDLVMKAILPPLFATLLSYGKVSLSHFFSLSALNLIKTRIVNGQSIELPDDKRYTKLYELASHYIETLAKEGIVAPSSKLDPVKEFNNIRARYFLPDLKYLINSNYITYRANQDGLPITLPVNMLSTLYYINEHVLGETDEEP